MTSGLTPGANLLGSLSGLPRILAALGTGGISELAINAKQNLDNQNNEALKIDAGSQIPAFAYNEQTPDQINQAKAKQLANNGGDIATKLFENYRNDPVTTLSNDEKKAHILNLQQEGALIGEKIKAVQQEQKVKQNLLKVRESLIPGLIEPSQEPQGPANPSGAVLPAIPAHITTDPDKLQQTAITALLLGDKDTATSLNTMQRNRNLNQQDVAKTAYYNAKAAGADTTNVQPTVLAPDGTPITGNEFLKTLPPVRATAARALVEGRGIYPTGTYAKSPAGQQLLADAQQYDPELDANTFKMRGKTQTEYGAGGSVGKNVVTLRTGIDHILHLADAINGLPDTGTQTGNSIVNSLSAEFGGKGIEKYNTILNTAAPEIVKAYVPTGGTEKDRNDMKDNFAANKTKAQKRTAIAAQAELMLNRLDEMQTKFDESMRRATKPLVSPETRAKLESLKNLDIETPIKKDPNTSPAPKVYHRINGQLVRVK